MKERNEGEEGIEAKMKRKNGDITASDSFVATSSKLSKFTKSS
jgi:hypothetical protein